MLRYVLLPLLLLASACATAVERDSYMRLYTVEGSFEDVRDDIEMAITDRGIKINNVSHIGNMLARTGKDIGASKRIFGNAEAIEFCSATVSRRMMEADPHNIVFCPYIIYVYTLPGETNRVYVAYRIPQPASSPASKAALAAVEALLQGIIGEVAQ